MSSFAFKLNPNTLLNFRKYFNLFKKIAPNDHLFLYLSQPAPNHFPRVVFCSDLEVQSSFCYFELSDDQYIEDFQVSPNELLLEIPSSTLFTNALKSFSDKVSLFSLTFSNSVITILHMEGAESELRTRNLSQIKQVSLEKLTDVLPFKGKFEFVVKTKDIIKKCESLNSSTLHKDLILVVERTPETLFRLLMELKGGVNRKIFEVTSRKIGVVNQKEKLRFRFDKAMAKTWLNIANVEEMMSFGVSKENQIYMKFEKPGEDGQKFEMGFKVPSLVDMDDLSEEEKEEEVKEERKVNNVGKNEKVMKKVNKKMPGAGKEYIQIKEEEGQYRYDKNKNNEEEEEVIKEEDVDERDKKGSNIY